jgi:succinyl-CoA synthetase beta subunit
VKLYEYEGKMLFRGVNIPTPAGTLVTEPEQAEAKVQELGYPVVIKSQVLSGGRGKSGGIRMAADADELEAEVGRLFDLSIANEKPQKLLIEEKIAIRRELYAGITLDPRASGPVLMVSAQGGMAIEELIQYDPADLATLPLDPIRLPRLHELVEIVLATGLRGRQMLRTAGILSSLIRLYFGCEAITTEINPLVIDEQDRVLAADARVEIDDAALFRVRGLEKFHREDMTLNPLEARAKAADISYVTIGPGDIGLIAGGAGLGMASVDMIAYYGGVPANFLDLGGDATAEKTAAALRIVLEAPGVRGVLVNVFGGINNCENMARGIVRVLDERRPEQTVVVKMRGHSQQEGWKLLEDRDIPAVRLGTTEDAIKLLLDAMRQREGA